RLPGPGPGRENPDQLVALLREPPDGPARVVYGLPAYLECPCHIRADDVVGPPKLRRHAAIVIRKAQPQRADDKARQQFREPDVSTEVRVPLRHDHDRAAP